MSAQESKVQVFGWSEQELERMMRREVQAVLGPDKDAIKGFQVELFKPQTAEQFKALARAGKPLFTVSVLLGLDDSGHNMRHAQFHMESGLTTKQDKEIARSLGHQCKICVERMKRQGRDDRGKVVVRA